MATYRGRERCRERIHALAGSAADDESLQREAVVELRRAIGFDRWCWSLADPDTLVPGNGMADHDYGPSLPRALELEYSGHDVGTKAAIARRRTSSGSLRTDTGGDLARSPRWEEVLGPVGIGDVAAVACRDSFGCWGWVELYRDRSDHAFADVDVELLGLLGPALGTALRRRVTVRPAAEGSATVPPPGVLVLDADLGLVSQTAAARAWTAAMPGAAMFAHWGMLHAVVYPVATLARGGDVDRAHAMLPAGDGTWIRIEAAPLEGDGASQVAVTVRAGSPGETSDLVCRARGLTRREREVAALLLAGLGTEDVTRRLHISRYTLQDHLKSIFAKLGVHSRTELVAALTATSH
ncbi:helix-turn-helix transcriptional regulator [Nocardioides sediminis]|uniref:helix-turn-helix transcriptional regulator n=1 Tax=Nocardioides sediminis TaxID=433648 RepID=UPI00131EFF81|nr:helix-turn-helix transcriptional regulator [Nocardioides sediminis]